MLKSLADKGTWWIIGIGIMYANELVLEMMDDERFGEHSDGWVRKIHQTYSILSSVCLVYSVSKLSILSQ